MVDNEREETASASRSKRSTGRGEFEVAELTALIERALRQAKPSPPGAQSA